MDSNEAAKTLLLRGKEVEFPADQAKRILDYQKVTGFNDYSEPDAEPKQPTANNAPDGQPSNPVDTDPKERGGSKKGGSGQ